MHQSTWKSFGDASEMHQKSTEFDMQGHTLTLIPILCTQWALSANSQLILARGTLRPSTVFLDTSMQLRITRSFVMVILPKMTLSLIVTLIGLAIHATIN